MQLFARYWLYRKRFSLFALLLMSSLLWCLLGLHTVRAMMPASNRPTLIEANREAAVVELVFNEYTIETIAQGERHFHRVMIPDSEQSETPGAPQVPFFRALLGLASTENVTVQLLDAEYEEITGYDLYPAPQLVLEQDSHTNDTTGQMEEHFYLDPAHYHSDSFFPRQAVALGAIDYIRGQAVAPLHIYPVSYNPVQHSLRIYHRLLVRVAWQPTVQAANPQRIGDTALYENLLQQTLLNYNALGRVPGATEPSGTVAAAVVQAKTETNDVPKLKIGVDTRGIYRIPYESLPATFQAALNATTMDRLTLENQGQKVAYYVQDGDNRFGPGDALLFYGVANHEFYRPTTFTTTRPYTTTNIYWLSIADQPGVRMASHNGVPNHAPTATMYSTTLHLEENTANWSHMPGDDAERWFWDRRMSPNTLYYDITRTYAITLNHLADTANPAAVRLRLKGVTFTDHRTRIYVNGNGGAPINWTGQAAIVPTFTVNEEQAIPQNGLLHEGLNTIRVETLAATAEPDQILVDWIEIDYWRRYVAEENQLAFDLPALGEQTFQLHGFATNDINVWNITEPRTPIRIENSAIVPAPNGEGYSLHFQDNLATPQRYLALTTTQFKAPAFMFVDEPSTLKAAANQASYIIITHRAFYPEALRLAQHRRDLGIQPVVVVNVDDIYDEFNHGILSPVAIRAFLAYTQQVWTTPAPEFVLFFGDANGDFLDYAHLGKYNYVPTQSILSRFFGEVPSDHWLVQLDDTGVLPDMMAGRLPAQTLDQARAMVDKIIEYDQQPQADWQNRVLLVADDDIDRFKLYAEEVAAQLPKHLPPRFFAATLFANPSNVGSLHSEIAQAINAGHALVTYFGHGEYFGWGTGDVLGATGASIFQNEDVMRLTNGGKLPVVAVANCLNGFFNGSLPMDAIAELFVRMPHTGAIAVWAPSAYERPSVHAKLMKSFYDELFVNHNLALGRATQSAQIAAYGGNNNFRDILTTYILFGDPALTAQIGPNPPYIQQTTPANGATGIAVTDPLRIVFSKQMLTTTVQIVGPIAVSFIQHWKAGNTELELRSTNSLAYATNYTFTISGLGREQMQLDNSFPRTWSFTTTADRLPVTTIQIQRGLPEATSPISPLRITFSEPVVKTTVTYKITPFLSGSLEWQDDQNAFYRHTEPFALGQIYTFEILTVKDNTGNLVEHAAQQTFQIREPSLIFLPTLAK